MTEHKIYRTVGEGRWLERATCTQRWTHNRLLDIWYWETEDWSKD